MAELQQPDPDVKTAGDILAILRRRKWDVIVPALLVFALAAAAAMLLPRSYKSTTTILIEEQEIPKEFVATNITSFADQRLQTINQRIMSTTKLIELVNRFRLYEELKDRKTIDEIVGIMRDDIKFGTISADVIDPRSGRPAQATIAFSVGYEGKQPETVQRVAAELASLYLEENIRTRERQSSETSKFMEEEMKDVKARMETLDGKIASYKRKNLGSLPELAQLNQQAVDQVDRDLDRMNEQLRALKQRESYLQQQLASIPQDTANQEKETLKSLKSQLVELKAHYSDEYPDVVRTKTAIKDLEEKFRKGGGSIAGTNPDNPAYVTLSSELAGVRSDIDSTRRQIKGLQEKRSSFWGRIEASPRVEEGYRSLVVERNNLQAKYDELTRKAMDAQVAHGLEREQLGERFTIVEAARLPERPSKPNVPAILLIGLVLGLGTGVGAAALKESTDTSAHTIHEASQALPYPVLTAIPVIVTPGDVRRHEKRRKVALGTLVAAMFVGIVLFHFFVMDLDVLWAKVARRLPL